MRSDSAERHHADPHHDHCEHERTEQREQQRDIGEHTDEGQHHERADRDGRRSRGLVDAVAGESDEGRKQRDAGHHHDQHGDRRGRRQATDERQADDEQPEHRDHHREPGEDHGPARRIDGADDGFLGLHARMETVLDIW